jgi:hypothetical protein
MIKCIFIAVLLGSVAGCSTVVPVAAKFPEPPGRQSLTQCPDLTKLPEQPTLSDVSRTVTQNYTTYYECAVKTDAWIEWYNVQKIIFENTGK